MFLKKSNFFSVIVFILLSFFFQKSVFAENEEIINYLGELNNFSVSFIQKDKLNLSEGKISVGASRVRVEYYTPTKILIILSKSKAMYYNFDLDEDEFFDPNDTSAWFFFEIFNNPEFFRNSKLVSKDNYIVVESNGINQNEEYTLKMYFENNPLLIRKIELIIGDTNLVLSTFNHKYNEEFDKNFFKLINPNFFN